MPWRFSRMSWSSTLFKRETKILCFCNHNYLACHNPLAWTQPCAVSTLHNKREMQVLSTFGRCQEDGVWGCVWGWRWQHCLTLHPAKEGATPDTEASLWTPTFNKHPESVCLPHQSALASYCKLLSHSLFLPRHNSTPSFTSHPLRFLHNKNPMSLLRETKG